MSPNQRRMPEINLEEFERRLRAAGSAQGGVEDPLEELTRLVNTIAADRPRDERVIDLSAVRPARPGTAPPQNDDDEPEFVPPPEVWQPAQRSLPAARDETPLPEPPLLRPAFEEASKTPPEDDLGRGAEPTAPPSLVYQAAPIRQTSWYWKVGGLTALALVMVAGAAALKFGGMKVGSKTPPMILAASGPSKVAPPDEKTVQSPSDTGALLTKDSTTTAPVKVVVNQEQPVELKDTDSPVAPMKDSPIIAPNQAPMVVASVPPTTDAPAAPAVAAPPAAAPTLLLKKPPKTVSVRPDGTLITPDAAPTGTIAPAATQPTPAARKPDAAPSVTSQPASPTLDLPPPPKPTKSSARVNVAKTDTTAPTEPTNAPLQLGSAASGATDKPAKLPTKLRPPAPPASPQVADTGTQPAAGGGDWAVQLAAPRSEAEAQSAIQRLQTKFGSALGETDLAVKKAEVNGETIYRVRASGLSKSEASTLCQKLKSDGGDCYVARN